MVAKPESVIGAKGAIQTMKKKQKTTAEVQAAIFRREHRKSPLRGGVKLTLKKARELALQEFGTAKGIQREENALPDYYIMRLGNTTNPFLILFDDLDGVTATGVWNAALQRIEC